MRLHVDCEHGRQGALDSRDSRAAWVKRTIWTSGKTTNAADEQYFPSPISSRNDGLTFFINSVATPGGRVNQYAHPTS